MTITVNELLDEADQILVADAQELLDTLSL